MADIDPALQAIQDYLGARREVDSLTAAVNELQDRLNERKQDLLDAKARLATARVAAKAQANAL